MKPIPTSTTPTDDNFSRDLRPFIEVLLSRVHEGSERRPVSTGTVEELRLTRLLTP
jgi:hypothetical protein